MKRILGLDIGTTSVGFALIEHDEQRHLGTILRMGVRIFPEGVTEKDKEPRNKARRQARQIRRQLRRRRLRRRELGMALAEAGLLPRFGTEDWHRVMSADPYDLRAHGVGQSLQLHDVGRALYHLGKRRGFLPARLGTEPTERDTQNEESVVKEAIAGLRREMASTTLGAFLATQQKRRGRHLGRDMVEAEFERLWAAQSEAHPGRLTPELHDKLHRILFHQRPTFWRLKTLGSCRLEPGAPLCAKGSWKGQHYVMLEQLNKLRIAGGNARPLDDEERAVLRALLERQASLTFGAARKALKPLWLARGLPHELKFNLEASEKVLRGNAMEAKLAAVFGKDWANHPARDRIRNEIGSRLRQTDYRQIGNKRIEIRRAPEAEAERRCTAAAMQRDWGITADQAAELSEIAMPAGWLRLSEAAIDKLLVEMERGIGVGELTMSPEWAEWRDRAFPNRVAPTGEIEDRLPAHPRRMPELRNPTVNRALNEVRKVVNNLVALHGTPDLIRVELARDLKRSPRERREVEKRQRDQEKARKAAALELKANGFGTPTRRDVEKWLLWKECNETCPYTGRKISFDDLFSAGRFQVEHIFPRSRSLDNSFANKTLCDTELNKLKGNQTPYEFFASDPERWETVRRQVKSCGLPEAKARRFMRKDFAEAGTEEFAERQLADTRYIAREARDFLKRLYPDIPGGRQQVETCNGSITAQLRRHWGLEGILRAAVNEAAPCALAADDSAITELGGQAPGKNRGDHRHHAIDALAVALTSRAFVKRLSEHYARERVGERPKLPLPWKSLFEDAKAKTEEIVVSHRVQRKVSGALHAQTAYGDTGREIVENGKVYRFFVARKNLREITTSQIKNIRDDDGGFLRKLVEQHVARFGGGNPRKAFPPYPILPSRNGEPPREVRKVRVLIKQQPELMVQLRRGGKTYADPSANHHMAIFQRGDGSVEFEIVSLFEATRRLRAGAPVVNRSNTGDRRFIMSIAPGDTLEMPNGASRPAYKIVTSVWASGVVVLENHNEASGSVWKRPNAASLIAAGARKVNVDPIGRVRPARD